MDNYANLIERIAHSASVSVEDIERRIEAKRAKLSGLVSKEGAAQIIAAELGINLDKERLKIGELMQGTKRAHVVGKVTTLFPVRSYSKQGRTGKVASMVLADDSASIRTVFWDVNHIALVENGTIKEGAILEVSNAMMRNGELHVSSFGDVKLSNEQFESVVSAPLFLRSKLKEALPGQRLQTRAFIVQIFDPRYFEVCSECGKKVVDTQCLVHGTVTPQQRAALTLLLDDGSESIRGVLFGEQIAALGVSDAELYAIEQFHERKAVLLGEELVFSGTVRNNQFFNAPELHVELIEPIAVDSLLQELERAVL